MKVLVSGYECDFKVRVEIRNRLTGSYIRRYFTDESNLSSYLEGARANLHKDEHIELWSARECMTVIGKLSAHEDWISAD